jgi:Zn-dependent protease
MFTGLTGLGIIVLLGSILVSMVLHEAMHAWSAHYLGDPTARDEGRLTLNPLAHIDLFATVLLPVALIAMGLPPFFVAKPVPFRPDMVRYGEYGAALVGIAGPLTNMMLALAGAVVFQLADTGTLLSEIAIIFAQVNVAFFVFNMIPWPPLDGSRLLFAVAPRGVQSVMMQIEALGLLSIFIFMSVYFLVLGVPVSNIMQALTNWLL